MTLWSWRILWSCEAGECNGRNVFLLNSPGNIFSVVWAWEAFGLLEEGKISNENRVLGIWPFGQSYCDPDFHLLLDTISMNWKRRWSLWSRKVTTFPYFLHPFSTAFVSFSFFNLEWHSASVSCVLSLLWVLRLRSTSTKLFLIALGGHLSFFQIPIAISCTFPIKVHDWAPTWTHTIFIPGVLVGSSKVGKMSAYQRAQVHLNVFLPF